MVIPLLEPCINGNELKYIEDCLKTGWISYAGKYVERLENDICAYTGAKYAVAVASGTAALEMALRVAGVKPGDEVLVPTITFVATINAIKHVGAEPIFLDSDDTLNIDHTEVLEFLKENCLNNGEITTNKNTGRRIAAFLPVHIFGNVIDFVPLKWALRDANISIVEDAAEALGSFDALGRHAGTIGDVGIFSFSFNKTITAGGGGIIITNSEAYAKKAKYLSLQAKDDPVLYIHNEVGYNIGMTNISAAIAVAQLEQLDDFLEKKKKIYNRYKEGFRDSPGKDLIAHDIDGAQSNYWLNGIMVEDKLGLMDRLTELGIQTRPLWGLNHLQKAFEGSQTYNIQRAPKLWRKVLNIPSGVTLTKEQQDSVINAINNY